MTDAEPEVDGAGEYAGFVSQLHVDLPEDLSDRVSDEAARRGILPSELVGEALVIYLGQSQKPLGIIGLGASGRPDISERVDEEVSASLRL